MSRLSGQTQIDEKQVFQQIRRHEEAVRGKIRSEWLDMEVEDEDAAGSTVWSKFEDQRARRAANDGEGRQLKFWGIAVEHTDYIVYKWYN